MKKLFVQMNDHSTIHKQADRFEIVDNSIRAYVGTELVAYADLGAVLYAHIYDKDGRTEDGK
ncbi:MAG: hypothetical protein IJX37_08965 [Oscillospiraceae bacterium]|nr:hypothetical protein [Oscillospiraceae bacterium]